MTFLRFVLPVALMALIFMLSAQPDLSTGLGFWDLLLRMLAHACVFGALTLLWLRALAPLTARPLLRAHRAGRRAGAGSLGGALAVNARGREL